MLSIIPCRNKVFAPADGPANSKETFKGLMILVTDMSELIRCPTDDEDCTGVEVNEFDTFGTIEMVQNTRVHMQDAEGFMWPRLCERANGDENGV